MTLDPCLNAPVHIQIHAASALVALVLGPVALYGQRRAGLHKTVGYVWVLAMASVSLSAFFIHSFAVIGPFSPLHGFAVVTLVSLWLGIGHARRGDITAHRAVFGNLYRFGLVLAGLANFMPGRTSNQAAFDGADHLGWWVIGAGVFCVILRAVLRQRQIQGGMPHVA
ncbi:DUF2306 domain-containing protein [Pseudooctadecabacter jejudonensis]|uniref:DUF2306 domain-containing protein n=1 Tax=Pseudooctadecabacter jejudonensis TaxID=1391910 RepID=A0A1Y5SGZ5_9RHOB|nr:DUF2306 domain-containing protein [Pseudooctadecabacter jejudonensis]SLN38873.1 hypothetical protein PSJ8397_01925 [Pseudooctadecabacter jejudonensis]